MAGKSRILGSTGLYLPQPGHIQSPRASVSIRIRPGPQCTNGTTKLISDSSTEQRNTHMNCLFIFPNAPLSQSYSDGGASRYTQAYQALVETGHNVHVLRLLTKEKKEDITAFEANLSLEDSKNYSFAKSWRDVIYKPGKRFETKAEGIIKGVLHPLEFTFPESATLERDFRLALQEVKPDFILAQMPPAGAVLAAIKPQVPWIYGHHDWWYRTRQVRKVQASKANTIGSHFTNWALRRGEEKMIQASAAVIAASNTEAEELRALGVKNCVTIPVTYIPVAWPPPNISPQSMRIVHFGNLKLPFNVFALNEYLDKVFPFLPSDWEFVVIGATNHNSSLLVERLTGSGAKVEGFVRDLTTVFRPFDVAIIPYTHNTGERTRVAQLFNFAQVVVTTEEAVKGSSHLRPNENCIVVSSLDEFPHQLNRLAGDSELRKKIGLEAKATFERELTLKSQLPLFKQVVEAVVLFQ